MPFGGLYLTGGVTNKLLHRITPDGGGGGFLEAYHDKGRVSPLLRRIPLFVIKSDNCGEQGAHRRAVALLRSKSPSHPHLDLKPEEMVPPRGVGGYWDVT
uniref:Uncharacterized protein n=1 Tax=Eutreptiella gymnastica TaxID=73025 RepID=A0A7S1N5E5_9EUGL